MEHPILSTHMKKIKVRIVFREGKDEKHSQAFVMNFFDGQRENSLRINSLDKRFDAKTEADKHAL